MFLNRALNIRNKYAFTHPFSVVHIAPPLIENITKKMVGTLNLQGLGLDQESKHVENTENTENTENNSYSHDTSTTQVEETIKILENHKQESSCI